MTVLYLTDHTDTSELSGAETLSSPTINCHRVSKGSYCNLRQEQERSRREQLSRGQDFEDVDDDDEEGEKKIF